MQFGFGAGAVVVAQAKQLEELSGALAPEDLTAADWLAALAAIVLAGVASMLVSRLVRRLLGQRPDDASQEIAKLVGRVAGIVVLAIGFGVALSFIGLDLGWLSLTLILLLVIAYLIARPLVENLSAGIALAARPAFDVGDDIGVEQVEGNVIDITQRSTVLELLDGTHVYVPNTDVLHERIHVFTAQDARRTSLEIELDESTDLSAAEQAIETALAKVKTVVEDPAPGVVAREFGNASVKLAVRFWHKSDLASGYAARDQTVRAVQTALKDAGIKTSTPRLEEIRHASERLTRRPRSVS